MRTNLFKITRAAILAVAMAFTFSCSDDKDGDGGGSIVYGSPINYEGKTYKTIVIGSQTWMAENLNYAVEGSECYDNKDSNCDTYGRLYNWATAMALPSSCNSNSCASQIDTKHMGICPSGWHIPSNMDWDKLMRYVDGTSGTNSPYDSPTAGRYLKATSGWNNNGNGEDWYGFRALPGGKGFSVGRFDYVGLIGRWWSATSGACDGYDSFAYTRFMYFGDDKYSGEHVFYDDCDEVHYLYSVRCLKD